MDFYNNLFDLEYTYQDVYGRKVKIYQIYKKFKTPSTVSPWRRLESKVSYDGYN